MTLNGTRISTGALTAVALGALALAAQTAPQLPADIIPASRARLPFIPKAEFNEADQKTFNMFLGQGAMSGPLAFAAYNPGVAKALLDLHNAAVAGSLNAHVRELAILVACRETNYNLEWNGHEQAAHRAGVDAKVIDDVRRGAPPTGIDEKDAAVIRFGRQLFTDKKVDSATFAKIVELYDKKGAMDMVAVMNTYAVSGFYAIAVDEQAAAGKTPLEPLRK
jgi:4-carboxymuconolactone decarboxylase